MALESLPKIAPALFSPEQDLIQIYNKKSDTLGVINASLIGGNTPPSGVSGAIQFSNGSAFASDAANLFWDDTNNRLGVGTNAPTEALEVVGQSRFSDNILFSTDFKHIGRDLNNSSISFSSINSRILAKISTGGTFEVYNSASGTSRFAVSNGGQTTISGGGSTAATTSLLVQNSSGTEVMRVRDDGFVLINNTLAFTSADYGSLGLYSAGVWNFNGGGINDTPRINWGGYTSLFPSLKRNGTAIDVRLADDSNYAQFNTGATFIKGSGSTSATTSLLVQNSSGVRLLETKDNGDLYIGNTASDTGTIYVPHSPTYADRVFMRIDGSFPLFSTVSNALLEISCSQFYTKGNMAMRNMNEGIIGSTAVQNNNSSIQLTTSVNAYNGTNQNDACNLLYIKNNGVILQAGGSVNFLKLDGTVNEAGGGGNKWCTGIYYNPTLTGGALLANSHYCYHATSGQMMVNTTSPQSSAQLQVDSTNRGFLPPRMTDAQIRAIASPAEGLVAYNTTISHLCCYQSGSWVKLNHSPM